MNWLKNKTGLTYVFIFSTLLDIGIGFLINVLSSEAFHIFDIHNLVVLIVFIMLVVAYVCCQLVLRNKTQKTQNKRLQKAFQESGGYDTVATEINKCIVNHDYKNIKALKKIVHLIEK